MTVHIATTERPAALSRIWIFFWAGLELITNSIGRFQHTHKRCKTYQALCVLDDHLLKDIGLSRSDIANSLGKRFGASAKDANLSDIRQNDGEESC